MKSFFSVIAMTLLIASAIVGAPASAARIGGLDPVGPTPYIPGVWRATVRYVNPHQNKDGTYSTYSYLQLVAETQVVCDFQLQTLSNSGASVVTWCWFDPY
jgi:uncharacterized protein with FMN-binding domain